MFKKFVDNIIKWSFDGANEGGVMIMAGFWFILGYSVFFLLLPYSVPLYLIGVFWYAMGDDSTKA